MKCRLFSAPRAIRQLVVTALICSAALMSAQVGQPRVFSAVKHDTSPPLREMAASPLAQFRALTTRHEVFLGRLPQAQRTARSTQPDAVLQTEVGASAPASVGLNFEGIGDGVYGFSVVYAPPDTNGAVGSTQYVQMVNDAIAVFNKTTGALVSGPVSISSVWSGFGGACENEGSGDPIVLYDKMANRWIVSQMAWPAGGPPFYECVAVSQTDDATGGYYRYAFSFTDVNDYPKLGVWPDAYYLSVNRFATDDSWLGTGSCALERANMLTGAAATMVCFYLDTSNDDWSLLPSDFDGLNAPPANSPNFFVEFDWDTLAHLRLYQFHVDFVTPANSTFTGPISIPVTAFTPACGGGTCIPQPAGDGTLLDSLADRLMFRLAYRNFGTHESLVVNHSVNPGVSGSAIRWYEIQNPAGTPVVAQQSTFAPADSTYRWMGSVAMDQTGNMLLGYSASSASSHPSIRFTGRLASDPASTMSGETTIYTGGGSQIGGDPPTCYGCERWGDYSSMSIDPVDDCTFWYTTEYIPTDGNWNWHTRITTARFSACGPDLVAGKSHLGNFVRGQTDANYTLAVSNVGSGPTDGSTVTVVDTLPAGLTATAIAGSGWGCTLATLTCTRSDVLAAGDSYPTITLTVNVASSAGSPLTNTATVSGGGDISPGNNTADNATTILAPDFTLGVTIPSFTVNAGQSATEHVTLTPTVVTVATTTFSCSGLPALSSCTFNPSTVPAQSGVTDVVLTVATTGPSAALQKPRVFYAAYLPFTGLGLVGMVLVGTRRKNRKGAVIFTALLLILMLLPLMIGCSSGGSAAPRTPAGTSTVTVTAVSGSFTHSTTFTLTVN